MRFATAEVHERLLAGVVSADGATFHPLPDGRTVEDLVAAGLDAALRFGRTALAGPSVGLDRVVLQAPLRPASVRDFVTFESHVEGVRRSVDNAVGVPEAWYDAPTFYFTNPHAIVGPDAPVSRPAGCQALDFELEVAAIFGGPAAGTNLTEAQATTSIFGYTILNDWSARDVQAREMEVGLGPAKGKDFCTSIGPWLVTADEFTDAADADGFLDLECIVEVNGSESGRDRLSHMGWTFATMIAFASRNSLVVPGDVLASGTTGGGGCLAELWGRCGTQDPPPLVPGDVVTLRVEGLGILTNTIVEGAPVPALTPFRSASTRVGSPVPATESRQ